MKHLPLTLLLLLPFPAAAQTTCATLGKTAETVMSARQSGMAMSAMMGYVDKTAPDEDSEALMRAMIIDAYNTPRYASPINRTNAAVDFRNAVELMCYEAGGADNE